MTKLVNLEVGDKVQLVSYGKFWKILRDFSIGDVFTVEEKHDSLGVSPIYFISGRQMKVSDSYELKHESSEEEILILENMLECFKLVEVSENKKKIDEMSALINKVNEKLFLDILTGKYKTKHPTYQDFFTSDESEILSSVFDKLSKKAEELGKDTAKNAEALGEALEEWTKSMDINNIGVSQDDADEAIDILKDIDNKKTPYEQIALMHNITVEELQDILLTFDNGDGDVLSLMSQRLNYEEDKS